MSQISEIDLPPEFAEDYILQDPRAAEKPFLPAEPEPLTMVAVVTNDLNAPEEVGITSPNGTQVRITADPITGGLRITQHQGEERGLLTVAPVGVGVLVLDDRA